jgi:hypothetical protein
MPRVIAVNDYRTEAGWRHEAIRIINDVIQSNPNLPLDSSALREVIARAYPWHGKDRLVARQKCWEETVREVIADRQKLANWNRSMR